MWKKNIVLSVVCNFIVSLFLITFIVNKDSSGYPGGTPYCITDAAPYCAGCHSACSEKMLRNEPEEVRGFELFSKKHYTLIENGKDEYEKLSNDERNMLLSDVKSVDANASVEIIAPAEVKLGEEVTVTVKVMGGAGPVVGVMLLDNDLWWQSRSVSADGWEIVGEPVIADPYGKLQTTFISKRAKGLKRNINYVNIYDINCDIEKNIWQESKVLYTLIPPQRKGEFEITAAFLYGTEKASKFGFTQTVRGKIPKGGKNGYSGRVMFSDVVKVVVK